MFSPTDAVKLLLASAFLCLIQHSCNATHCASSCGNFTINYPFRLITDPRHCGHKRYKLSCQDNALLLYIKASRTAKAIGYPVRAINYNNFTIRVVYPTVHMVNCALPTGVRSYDEGEFLYWYLHGYQGYGSSTSMLIFVSCPYPMSRSSQVYNSTCNLKRYWYLKVDYYYQSYLRGIDLVHLDNGCSIEGMYLTSLLSGGTKNMSYIDVINSFAYGFELSWEYACCASEATKIYDCSTFEVYCDDRNWNRETMTNGFDYLFSFFNKIGDETYGHCTSVFRGIFVSLNNTLGGHVYDKYDNLTVFGLISNFLLAILISSKVLSCFLEFICVTIFLICKWRRRHLSAYDNVEEFLQNHQNYLMPVRYSYSEIKKISRGFKEKLEEGGYGSVYKGKLRSGSFAAIKMLNKSKSNGQDFINEVATIGRIHHANVVRLIGFCVEGSKRALVYEFMTNGSLDKHIFSKEGCIAMCNKMIYDVCLRVAYGIQYLHHGCDMQILHFDIKPHNILLDENFVPKISDFGLAKLHSTDHSIVSLTAARGTMGYIAPEFFYKNIGGISYKADVYNFGMLLMEMVGRRRNINAFTEHSSRVYFPSWIYDQFKEEKDIKLDDTGEESNLVKKMIIVALWCIQLNPIDRPSMRKVIEMLEGKLEHLKMPPKPFVTPQETLINDAGLHINSEITQADTSKYYSDTVSVLIH